MQPKGCPKCNYSILPKAIEPPLILTFSIGISSFSMQYAYCEANASLISNKSISLIFRLFFFNNFGIAIAGPTPYYDYKKI